MANDLNIRIKINSDTKQLEITQDGFDKIREKSSKASEAVSGLEGSLRKIAALGAAALTFTALTSTANDFISTAGKFEQYSVSLKVLSGSAQKAEESFAWVKDFTAKTPYTLDQTMEAFIRLKAYGIDATDGSLKTLGDTSAALGKPLMAAVEAMADAMTGENERLKEFGITASVSGKTIAYNWIDSSGQAKTAIIENNKHIVKSTLEAIFNEKYAGMMDEQAKTWVGSISNLEDSWTSLKDTIARDSGMFNTAKGAVESLNKVLSNQSGELDTIARYTKDAIVLGATYYAVTLGAKAVDAIKTLTAAQNDLNLATLAWNRLLAVNPLIIGGMVLAGGIAYFYDMAQKADQEAKRSYGEILKVDKAYADYYSTAEGKAAKMGSSYSALEQSLQSLQKQRNSATGEQASRLDQAIASTKKQMDTIQSSAKNLYIPVDNVPSPNNNGTDNPKKGKTPAQIEAEELRKVTDRLEKQKTAQLEYYTTIGDYASVWSIKTADEMQQMAASKMLTDAQMIDVFNTKHNQFLVDEKKRNEEASADQRKQIESRMAAEKEFYSSLFQLSGDYYTSESIKIGEQYNEWEKAGIDKLQLQAWLNASMSALDKRRYDDQLELAKKTYEEENKFWLNLFGDVEKAMGNQLFDAMTGKWQSFGNWFKDFWSSLSTSVTRAVSSQLSTSMIGSIKEMFLGSPGGIQNVFRGYGLFGGADIGVGSTLTKDQINQLGGIVGTYSSTPMGTVIDSAGKVVTAGGDLSSLTGALGIGKLLSGASLAGIAAGIATPFQYLAGGAQMLGLNGLAAGIGNFGLGAGSVFTGASAAGLSGGLLAGNLAMSGALGGLGGYALGTLGDALFGAQTKAGSYGAIGGAGGAALGALGLLGPVGWITGAIGGSVIGSLIGGLFGKKKDDGITIEGDATAASASGHFDYIKKSWFSTKRGISSWFSEEDEKGISAVIGSYNYLLTQMGELDKTLAVSGGKFASIQDFLDRGVAQTFIDTITAADTADMYDAWSGYAKSLNKTIQSALSDSINTYIGDTRNFQTWMLERSGNNLESLKLKSEWAAADTANLQKLLGLEDVTIDNYLSRYKDAINNSFDPQTLQNYKTFGEQLMSNTEAVDIYTNALKEQVAVTAKLKPADMMLSRVSDTTSVTGSADGTVTKEMLDIFNRLIRSIDQQNTLAQLAAGRA